MPKSPPRAALDNALSTTVTPDLKSFGFRKRSLVWTLDDDHRRLTFSIEASTFNDSTGGEWRCSYEWQFRGAAADGSDITGRKDIGQPMFAWFWLDRPGSLEELRARIEADWTQILRPIIDASHEPSGAIAQSLAMRPKSPYELSALVRAAMLLGEQELVESALDLLLERTASLPPDGLWTFTWGLPNPFPAGLGVGARTRLATLLDRLPEPSPDDGKRPWWRPIAVAVGRLGPDDP